MRQVDAAGLSGLMLLVGCASMPQAGRADASASGPACRGTAAAVVVTCGCNPVDSRLLARVDAFKFNESARLAVENCATGSASAGTSRGLVLQGCLKEQVQLDEKMRDAMAKLISESDKSVSPEDKNAWNACYQRVTAQAAQQRSGPPVLSDQQFATFAQRLKEGRALLDAVYRSCADTATHTAALDAMRSWEVGVARDLASISPRLAFRFQEDVSPTSSGPLGCPIAEMSLYAKYERELQNLKNIMNSSQEPAR